MKAWYQIKMKTLLPLVLVAVGMFAAGSVLAGGGEVKSHQKISSDEGNFGDTLDPGDRFGSSATSLEDLDGDGVVDIAVGARFDYDGCGGDFCSHGAVWVLFLNSDGTVKAYQKISSTYGNFAGELDDRDEFGCSVASLGDLDDDGVVDIAVGADRDGDGGARRGAVWVLFLNSDGTVKAYQKISDTEGNFIGTLDNSDYFGISTTSPGDLDGDGVSDLAVGAIYDDDGGSNRGAVYVLNLNSDGTVKAHQKISDTEGGFTGTLDDNCGFGGSVTSLGDLDGDGVGDLAVGALGDDDGGDRRGAVWVLFLNSDGTVKTHQKISDTEGNFTGTLDDVDFFGCSVTSLGDLDGDGVNDISVGAYSDDDGGAGPFADRGAVWVLFLNGDGTVKAHQKISDTEGNFTGTLDDLDNFGISVTSLGDLDGDGIVDLAAGANGIVGTGVVWVLRLESDGTVKAHQKISDTEDNFTGKLDPFDLFGSSVTPLGDLDGDGVSDLAVGAPRDYDGGPLRGAVWVLFLDGGGAVEAYQKISDTEGNFTGTLDDEDHFGNSVTSVGDLDGDGVIDLAVGAYFDDDGGLDRGAVWVLFLNSDGTVKAHQKISDSEGNFAGALDDFDKFGSSLASMGDLDGDGVGDLAVGASDDDDGGNSCGAVWVLFLNSDGTARAHQKISRVEGNFTGVLDADDGFGASIISVGDLDGDGMGDLAVGALGDDDGGASCGAAWVLFLNSDGTVKAHQKISRTEGNFTGVLDVDDRFGASITSLGDFDGDSVADLAVGAVGDADGGSPRGSVWVLVLNSDGTVKAHQKISDTEGNFAGTLDPDDDFGSSVASLGDLDGDGVVDIAVGAADDDDGGRGHGAVWVLFLEGGGVPVALQSYDSRWTGDHVEVTWLLREVRSGVAFEVSRRVGSGGSYRPVSDPEIVQNENEFVFIDRSIEPRRTYNYRVLVMEDGEVVTSFETTISVPSVTFALEQNYPNPFNPSTQIRFSIDRDAVVQLSIYDVSGKLVRTLVNRTLKAGAYVETWDGRDTQGSNVASGIYFYHLTDRKKSLTRKAVLLR
jgi:hypothetical protein